MNSTQKNAMQLKSIIKKIANDKKISAQLVLQNYMLERFLERVSNSEYRNNFIIKGGFLIASIVGLNNRATMDMDVTIKRYPVSMETIKKMIEEIIEINLEDNIVFNLKSINNIREEDEYMGYRVSLSADYPPMAVPLKLDITTGDRITPREIEYEYKLMMEERSIHVLAYNMGTILAEKLETIISRGDQNTRPRDYYDVFILTKIFNKNIDLETLALALDATTKRRGSASVIKQYREIVEKVRKSNIMNQQWNNYQKTFDYAADIEFSMTCDVVICIMDYIIGL